MRRGAPDARAGALLAPCQDMSGVSSYWFAVVLAGCAPIVGVGVILVSQAGLRATLDSMTASIDGVLDITTSMRHWSAVSELVMSARVAPF